MPGMERAEEILDFWFGQPGHEEYETGRAVWFRPSRRFDEELRIRFLAEYEAAHAGLRDAWTATARTCLALTIALDQFPRNLFRNDPRAYASDHKALAVARDAVSRGLDLLVRPVERNFFYLPFQHSEELADQRLGVELYRRLADHPNKARGLEAAERHLYIVARFGRFPHRNPILGRASTPAEIAFLTEPNSSFLHEPAE